MSVRETREEGNEAAGERSRIGRPARLHQRANDEILRAEYIRPLTRVILRAKITHAVQLDLHSTRRDALERGVDLCRMHRAFVGAPRFDLEADIDAVGHGRRASLVEP